MPSAAKSVTMEENNIIKLNELSLKYRRSFSYMVNRAVENMVAEHEKTGGIQGEV